MMPKPFLSSLQIWYSAGIFVTVLALVGWRSTDHSVGMVQDPDPHVIREWFQDQLVEAIEMEVLIAEKTSGLMDRTEHVELRELMEQQRKQSASHADRLRLLATKLDLRIGEGTAQNKGPGAMLADVRRALDEVTEGGRTNNSNAVLIAGLRQMAHYEMAVYENLITTARSLEEPGEIVDVLEETLKEVRASEERYSMLAEDTHGQATRLKDAREGPAERGGKPYERVIPQER